MIPAYLWAVFTITAAAAQTLRNVMQRQLIKTLGTLGATQVRFVFGLPVAIMFLALVLYGADETLPATGNHSCGFSAERSARSPPPP